MARAPPPRQHLEATIREAVRESLATVLANQKVSPAALAHGNAGGTRRFLHFAAHGHVLAEAHEIGGAGYACLLGGQREVGGDEGGTSQIGMAHSEAGMRGPETILAFNRGANRATNGIAARGSAGARRPPRAMRSMWVPGEMKNGGAPWSARRF
jgi:hypothetical protein